MNSENRQKFCILFKKLRLKSEFATLSELGEALNQEGFLIEESIFSKWQSGNRIPRDRKILITVIKIFIQSWINQT